MNLRITTHRIVHGTKHMPAHALILRTAVVLFGVTSALTISDPLFGFLAAAITAVAGTSALWELYDAAIECEEFNDDLGEDHPDENGDEFGTAA